MRAYSLDLREKIVKAYDKRVSTQGQIAQTFGVSRSFIEKLLRRRRTTGDISPLSHGGGGQRTCDEQAQAVVRRLVREQPDATLEELCEELFEERGIQISVATMCTELKRLDLRRKKVSTLQNRTNLRSRGSEGITGRRYLRLIPIA